MTFESGRTPTVGLMTEPDTVPHDGQPDPRAKRKGLGILGFGAAACVACCIGPILAVLGAITAAGVISTLAIGAAGLAIAAVGAVAFVAVLRRSPAGCQPASDHTVPVASPTRRTPRPERRQA